MNAIVIPTVAREGLSLTAVAGIAFAAGRLRERVAALSRHVTTELQRFSRELAHSMDGLDRRMRVFEALLPHIYDRLALPQS